MCRGSAEPNFAFRHNPDHELRRIHPGRCDHRPRGQDIQPLLRVRSPSEKVATAAQGCRRSSNQGTIFCQSAADRRSIGGAKALVQRQLML
jgi:hypothetical protein